MDEMNYRIKGQPLPPPVLSRARAAGDIGGQWLDNLNALVSELETKWKISVGKILSGGTHALVAHADDWHGEKYILKVEIPDMSADEFQNSMTFLQMIGGRGYVKLFAYDVEKRASLMERLGKPVNQLGYPLDEQLRIICSVLQESWQIPAAGCGFPDGGHSIAWFRGFIMDAWEKLHHPCSQRVVERAMLYLQAREKAMNPAEFVLIHGDAHGGNTLQDLSGTKSFKLIDPDGIYYEKAYDLGVLMREWIDDHEQDPLRRGKERCRFLASLTGVGQQAIWEWGYLQTVSTALIALQAQWDEIGSRMLRIAEEWSSAQVLCF